MDYNGIPITLNERTGKFSAVCDGRTLTAPSIAALRKAMDKKAADTFQSFQAIAPRPWSSSKDRIVTIVGVKQPRANQRYRSARWIDDKGVEHSYVRENSPANIAAIAEHDRIEKENAEAYEKMKERAQIAEDKIVVMIPPKS